ncbi:MAG TPA: four helix bundle protein [Bacteroidales bacterium]|nr:four helix bundle protein [Bacteroidales bacterium]
MDKNELLKRTRSFAISVFKLVDGFPKSKAADVVAYQLLKSSSSVAANYRAVLRAKSKIDFTNKLKIVVEEADESNFWLTFIIDIELMESNFVKNIELLIKESDEFVAIFTKSIKTINGSFNKS